MLNDPLSVTYDGSAKSLPRASGVKSGVSKVLGETVYTTANQEFRVFVTQSLLGDGGHRAEILLERMPQDADGDPFTGNWRPLPNRVGMVFETNSLHYLSETDVPKLRTALIALVDNALSNKLIGGQL